MTPLSSVTARRGFTPLPVEVCSPSSDFCGAGRGLSIPNAATKQCPFYIEADE